MMLTEERGCFFFDPEDPMYHDHFPNQPVVPGSLIIEAFLKTLEKKEIKATAIKRFRFIAFAAPGSYTYKLVIKAGLIDCYLFQDEQKYAVGKILYDQ
jgi:3-hydroxyacyl-[acyl-carrier-protein] dehydratase